MLVIQDVCTLHGSQFKNATLIVASPPCQEYSYMAMPWTLAKAKAKGIRADATGEKLAALNRLFNQCQRLQLEASVAAGRHIPLIIENVRGAQPWVGRARWSFGSFYLWGDVPALMPIVLKAAKVPGLNWSGSDKPGYVARGFNTTADQRVRADIKNTGGSWFNVAHNTTSGKGQNPDGRKGNGGTWFHEYGPGQGSRNTSSKGKGRQMAQAMIAKIPLPLSRHIGATFACPSPS